MENLTRTSNALSQLGNTLICTICSNLLKEPCSLGVCDHLFCKCCIMNHLEMHLTNTCPECSSPAWVKDLMPNRELTVVVQMYQRLQRLVKQHPVPEITAGEASDSHEHHPKNSSDGITPDVTENKCGCSASYNVKFEDTTENVSSSNESENDYELPTEIKKISTKPKYFVPWRKRAKHKTSRKRIPRKARCPRHTAQLKENIRKNKYQLFMSRFMNISDDGYWPHESNPMSPKTRREKIKSSNEIWNEMSERISKKNNKSKRRVSFKSIEVRFITTEEDESSSEQKEESSHNGNPFEMLKTDAINAPHMSSRKRSLSERDQSSTIKKANNSKTAFRDLLSKKNKKGETSLHIASIKGDVEEVKKLLEQGADANARDYAGWRPLHEAANHGHAGVVSLLLEYGALIDAPGFENDSPLHDAMANNRLDVVRILVKNGANLMARNMFGVTPYSMAKTKVMKNALKKVLPVNERVSSSSIKLASANKNNQFVFIYTGLNDEQKETMEICTKILGAKLLKTFSNDVTHVIASCTEAVCLRTMKYLQGVVAAKWVISFDWVESCLNERKAVDEEPFLVLGTMSSPSSPGPMRARINTDRGYPPLFDGCHFYFHGTYTTPSKEELGQLVKLGGGILLLREPKTDDDVVQSCRRVPYHSSIYNKLPDCCYFIINSPLQDPLMVNTFKLCSVPLSWLLDCIAQFQIVSTEDY